ncbi:MAG: EFR1 family ferrodoxin [Oscillospiraceae bacterium]|jgi:ferredoxin
MIFYFTGTGNSLYAAKSLDEKIISIPQVIDNPSLHFSADRIGIAAPVYGHEMPQMVKEFIRRAEFDTDYTFVILTYGNRHANAVDLARNVFESAGKHVDYIHTVLMADNFLPAFDMREQAEMDKNVEGQLSKIKADIAEKKHDMEEVTQQDRNVHEEYLKMVHGQRASIWADFDFTDRCIGCGICAKVCPAGCIYLEGNRAVFTGDNCQACMACVHSCPEMAIKVNKVLGLEEPNPKARYRNENVTLTELVRSNCRKTIPAEAK